MRRDNFNMMEGVNMKIIIVTVYNSINSGSFWQAKALETYLSNMGLDVYFLKRNNKGSSVSFYNKFCKLLKAFFQLNFSKFFNLLSTFYDFSICEKHFRTLNFNDINSDDIIILGSDTIWNVDSKYFLDNYTTYFGSKFNKFKVVSYAGSFANTSIKSVKKINNIGSIVDNWHSISVRDTYSFNIMKELTNKKINMVCDPTLLLDKNNYQSLCYKPSIKKKYIFLYLFDELTSAQKKSLYDFALKNDLLIIDGMNLKMKTDYKIINTPYNFLSYMFYADYIITDTFHGTVFSVNLEKQFVSINRNKNKVNDFLKIAKFDDRLFDGDNFDAFNSLIDYSNRIQHINALKNSSRFFLSNVLDVVDDSTVIGDK